MIWVSCCASNYCAHILARRMEVKGKGRSSLLLLGKFKIITSYSFITTWLHGHTWMTESLEYCFFQVVICVILGPLRSKHEDIIRNIKALLEEISMKNRRERVGGGRNISRLWLIWVWHLWKGKNWVQRSSYCSVALTIIRLPWLPCFYHYRIFIGHFLILLFYPIALQCNIVYMAAEYNVLEFYEWFAHFKCQFIDSSFFLLIWAKP